MDKQQIENKHYYLNMLQLTALKILSGSVMSHMCKISMTENQCLCHPSPWSPDSCSFKCRAAALYPSISSSSSSSSCSLRPPSQLLEKILVDCCGWWSWGKKEETQDAEGRWVGAAEKWWGCCLPPLSTNCGFRVFRCSGCCRCSSCKVEKGEQQQSS